MSRAHEQWTDLLSDYLEGALTPPETTRLEAHLAECGRCRETLATLRDVVGRADALGDLVPPRDLWPGIASAIGGPVRATSQADGVSVIELPSARATGAWARRERAAVGRSAGGPLAGVAAAAALVVVSVGATLWLTGVRPGATDAVPLASAPAEAVLRPAQAGTPPSDLASELATLEEVLAAARDALDPNTVRVLERNLGVIEQAIADSREALALDPGNAFLTEHLERMYRRKLVYLQDAVRVAQWTS
jgi:anti-sigma factor ChrR (cupin superfamily)